MRRFLLPPRPNYAFVIEVAGGISVVSGALLSRFLHIVIRLPACGDGWILMQRTAGYWFGMVCRSSDWWSSRWFIRVMDWEAAWSDNDLALRICSFL